MITSHSILFYAQNLNLTFDDVESDHLVLAHQRSYPAPMLEALFALSLDDLQQAFDVMITVLQAGMMT